jgi:hypothetical protein
MVQIENQREVELRTYMDFKNIDNINYEVEKNKKSKLNEYSNTLFITNQ